ncbi:MAG: thioredoxin fold domain-containing protein [Candidatus Bathyarchaeota archaeon]|nr:MAG: thioredoxin fold domain-containing protein [Candidatus Bathyarchaeota archaeon]
MGSTLKANANNWRSTVLQSDLLTVVDFWHDNCPWCLKLNPIFDEIAEEYKARIKFVKFNVLENPSSREIAVQQGIMSTPTMMFFCKGRPVGQALGFTPKERLREILNDMLREYKNCLDRSTELKI